MTPAIGLEPVPGQITAERRPTALVVGRPTDTNMRLASAFTDAGYDAAVTAPDVPADALADLVLARLDVLPTLDGVEGGIWALKRLQRAGAVVLNQPLALLGAHDKLATSL